MHSFKRTFLTGLAVCGIVSTMHANQSSSDIQNMSYKTESTDPKVLENALFNQLKSNRFYKSAEGGIVGGALGAIAGKVITKMALKDLLEKDIRYNYSRYITSFVKTRMIFMAGATFTGALFGSFAGDFYFSNKEARRYKTLHTIAQNHGKQTPNGQILQRYDLAYTNAITRYNETTSGTQIAI